MDILHPFFNVSHEEYREPFAGGATVFFNKPKVKHSWLNDIDYELIETYRVMQCSDRRQDLIKLVSNEVASKDRWKQVKEFEPKNSLEVAFKYYYLNRTSFSGKLISPAWGYREKRSLPPARWHERLIPCGEKLSNVQLSSIDFEEVINAPPSCSGGVLLYVDPPYFTPPKKKHYRYGMTPEDHQRLANALKKTNHKFFLTYDDCEEIRSLYSWANIYELAFFYRVQNSNTSNGSRRIGFELVISNYKIEDLLNL